MFVTVFVITADNYAVLYLSWIFLECTTRVTNLIVLEGEFLRMFIKTRGTRNNSLDLLEMAVKVYMLLLRRGKGITKRSIF